MVNDALTSNDRQLTLEQVTQLADAAHVTGFFAHLGYRVDDSVTLTHAALGLDNADLRQQIQRLRRVGVDPLEGRIVIYLFEVRSVTNNLVQAIARRFRDRTEDAILILTKDYTTLDVVLLEKEVASASGPGKAFRHLVRPRVVTVNRRQPAAVVLRVLKRFTVTETDADFQWEKLRSAFTLAEWSEPYFNNHALFSDHYLRERLSDPRLTPAWAEDVKPIGREVLRHLSQARDQFSGQPAQVVRQQLYEPLWQSLGFQAVANQAAGASRAEADYKLYAPGQPDQPIALAMTTVWNRNLDDADLGRDHETPDEIPGALVVSVLARAETPWVIVTNGKLWRLYSTTAANKATNTYEVDLEEAVAAPDQETALKYWWLFFRRQAFSGFLDELVQQSADYARSLGERLKERTFTTIFPHFAAGFIAHLRAHGTQVSASLDETFQATLTFLYRLMFILYAESLNLLPVNEAHGYGAHSLAQIKKELAEIGGAIEDEAPEKLAAHYHPGSTTLYGRLHALFRAIDAGDEALNLPTYNGGLFSASTPAGRFLADHAIPDRDLALGLDRLCRDVDDKTQALAMIDYKSLGVRQLGSIYEGLLEFKLRSAAEALVVVKEKGKEVYLPASQAGGKKVVTTLAPGAVYLENDRRERKATGSYYTPDYIVKYIVEHTVGPVLARKFEALTPRLRAAQQLYRQRRAIALTKHEDPEKFWNNPDMTLLADDCLDVRVLDPAMGSGHFLVEAVDFVSDRLIQFLNGWSENPVWALLARTRQDILADMERQGVSIDAERLTRVALLKRAVLKRCIYGVDLNAMAVELAKVSLWLDAFTLGAPLSFLDHHLKHGNSLIGARVKEVRETLEARPGQQLGLFSQSKFAGVMLATDLMRQVSYLSDNTAGQLQASQAAFRSAHDHLAPYKRVLDVYTSRWFGNHPNVKKADAFDPPLEFLQRSDVEAWLQDPDHVTLPERDYMEVRRIGETALQAAEEKRFFHWELEFPEVFFAPRTPGGQDVELREDGGFDAVVGNPPWGADLDERTKRYCYDSFSTKEGEPETHLFMTDQSLYLLCPTGAFGFVTPNTWLTQARGKSLRRRILTGYQVMRILHLRKEVFPEVPDIVPMVCVVGNDGSQFVHIDIANPDPQPPSDIMTERFWRTHDVNQAFWISTENCEFNIFRSQHDYLVCEKIETASQKLNINYLVRYGVRTGDNVRYLHSDKHDEAHLPCLVNASEVDFYEILWNGVYIDPKELLSSDKLAELRNPKILVQYTRKLSMPVRIKAAVDSEGHFVPLNRFSYVIAQQSQPSLPYLMAVLSSSTLNYYHAHTFIDYDIKPTYLQLEPIRHIAFDTFASRRAELATEARTLYQRSLSAGHAALLAFVTHHLALDESDVIHDLLAFLAERMIELNKQKQAEVKRFLGWLEEKLRIKVPGTSGSARHLRGIDSLTGKTILQGYLGDYQKGEKETTWADFVYRLHQNRSRFAASLEAVQGEIEGEYEKSLAVLRPIKHQLARTDALIDQIVYQLYGLTDEEITIVERPAYEQALGEAKAEVLRDKTLAKDPEAAADAIAEKVLPAAQRLQAQVSLAAERQRLDQDLPGWHLFPDEVVTSLLTAEYNIANLPDVLDFSTSVITYAKAVEAMLYQRLFVRFRADSGATETDCRNAHLQRFMLEGKPLTLGSMAIILASSHEPALRRYIVQLYPRAAATFFGAGGVVERLNDTAAVDLRNRAAHDTTLTRTAARSTREWALGILQYL